MLKVEEQKNIFDIANVIGNIRTDLSNSPASTTDDEKKETKSEKQKPKKPFKKQRYFRKKNS